MNITTKDNSDLSKPIKQKKPCKHCRECPPTHTQYDCFSNPRHITRIFGPLPKKRSSIRKVSFKSQGKEEAAKRLWFSLNPPDEYGQWDCYLGIHPGCLIKVDEYTITQEHVMPKGRYPELKYNPKNRKAACDPCNQLKSGIHIEKIIQLYPHSKVAIDKLNLNEYKYD